MIGWSEKGEVSGEGVSLVRRREERLKRFIGGLSLKKRKEK